jgi:hypothetical protein
MSVTINDMQRFAESVVEPRMSSDIGNVIELGESGSLGDDLGFGLLTNTKVMSSSGSSNGGTSHSVAPATANASDISIGPLEPLEPISFDFPSDNGAPPLFPEVTVRKESDVPSYGDNSQTASGPGIQLSAPAKRLSPEEERKEKADMINKLNRLETKGFQISRRFTMDNTLEEIKTEYDRLMDARNLEGSIKFQRQMMMGVVTGLELMNNKFNPFDWQLDGWSESVHENVDDYDEVFEELYDKYKGKGNMPPEARLLFMMVGSGFMFHMSNSFFRQKMGNMTMDDILKGNPGLAKQMAAAAAQAAGPGFGNFMGAAMGVPPQTQPPFNPMTQGNPGAFFQAPNSAMPMAAAAAPQVRREMKGPSNVDDILQTFKEVREAETGSHPMFSPPPANSSPNPPANRGASASQALQELQSLGSDDVQSMGSSATGRTGNRKRKAQLPMGNTMSLNV